jgi:hypothetical protein
MNLIGLKRRLVLRLHDLHDGVRPQQLNQQAFVVGIEVLHEDKGHARVGRHVVKEVSNAARPPADAPMPTTSEGDADGTRSRAHRYPGLTYRRSSFTGSS